MALDCEAVDMLTIEGVAFEDKNLSLDSNFSTIGYCRLSSMADSFFSAFTAIIFIAIVIAGV